MSVNVNITSGEAEDMSILYRCDVERMGWKLNTCSLVRKRIISNTYDAELLYRGESISCLATLYPGKAYKIEYITDRAMEQKICDEFIGMLKANPRQMFIYFARTLVKIVSCFLMLLYLFMAFFKAVYVLMGGSVPLISFVFYFGSFICYGMIKYSLNLV